MTAAGYVSAIHILKTHTHEDVRIETRAGDRPFQHIIFIGKNGAGKTSTLGPLAHWLESPHVWQNERNMLDAKKKAFERVSARQDAAHFQKPLADLEDQLRMLRDTYGVRAEPAIANEAPMVVHIRPGGGFDAKPVQGPRAENVQNLKTTSALERANFVQYLVNQRFEMLNLREDGKEEAAQALEAWFGALEDNLSRLLGSRFTLKFERSPTFRYSLVDEHGHESPLDSLPDGWKALLKVFTHLLRVHEAYGKDPIVDASPCVLIFDEPELHLHPALQWTVLPTLVALFPQVQIIAATQSPIVAASLENALLFDLSASKELPTAFGASAETVLVSTFGTQLRENKTAQKLRMLENLVDEEQWGEAQKSIDALSKELPDSDPDLSRITNLMELARALDN